MTIALPWWEAQSGGCYAPRFSIFIGTEYHAHGGHRGSHHRCRGRRDLDTAATLGAYRHDDDNRSLRRFLYWALRLLE
jgi:hypothetical protein